MSEDIKFINVKEFREQGFLQEANRLFFHRLGLALSVQINDDGTESFGGIWDYREDPEGIAYGEGVLSVKKAENVLTLFESKTASREEILGFDVQPVE